jgi:hypothetical protein
MTAKWGGSDRVGVWQFVERHVGIGVVIGVIGHVPREQFDHFVRQCRARVFEHIGDLRAASVLGQKIQT